MPLLGVFLGVAAASTPAWKAEVKSGARRLLGRKRTQVDPGTSWGPQTSHHSETKVKKNQCSTPIIKLSVCPGWHFRILPSLPLKRWGYDGRASPCLIGVVLGTELGFMYAGEDSVMSAMPSLVWQSPCIWSSGSWAWEALFKESPISASPALCPQKGPCGLELESSGLQDKSFTNRAVS